MRGRDKGEGREGRSGNAWGRRACTVANCGEAISVLWGGRGGLGHRPINQQVPPYTKCHGPPWLNHMVRRNEQEGGERKKTIGEKKKGGWGKIKSETGCEQDEREAD